MQNGTNEVFTKRAEIEEMIDEGIIMEGRSDTYALGMCINKHMEKREEVIKMAV